jgi:hypothetical protein
VRRLTSHPEYVDPIDFSPDGVVRDRRHSRHRPADVAGMRDIPTIVDLVTSSTVASTRINGARRFFNMVVLDWHGDRGDYFGQNITGEVCQRSSAGTEQSAAAVG